MVPRARKAPGHGADYLRGRKRGRRDESVAATPSTRVRRVRRAVNYADPEPDDDEEDLELGPADDDDGWD